MNQALNLPKTPVICSRPEEAPKNCSFCEQPVDKSSFIALTKTRPYGVICSSCIERLAVVSQFYKSFSTYYEDRPWDEMKDQIRRALAGEDGTDQAKKTIAALVLRFAQRAASIGCGVEKAVDPKTKTFLCRPRVALVGKGASATSNLLMATPRITGLPVHVCNTEDLKSGKADMDLYKKCAMDERILKNSIIFVANGYAQSQSESAIVYCCESEEGLPAEVHLLRID